VPSWKLPAGKGSGLIFFRNIRNRVSELPGYEKFETDHKMREIEISEEPIELYKILKFENMVASGGEAKYVISEGQVLVNGKIEIRKRKKIFSGDVVEFGKNKLRIKIKRELKRGRWLRPMERRGDIIPFINII
jgi:ribosome-associated protein